MEVGRRDVVGLVVVATVVAAAISTSPKRALSTLVALGDRPLVFGTLLVGVYAARPFLAWPPTAVAVCVGLVLGPVAGFPVALSGTVASSLVPYYLGDRFRTETGLTGRVVRRCRDYFGAAGDLRGVTAARIAPIPADAVSVSAGLSGVSPRAYVAGTAVGELPWTVAAVLVGGSARTLATTGTAEFGPPLVVATTLAALLLLAGPLYRRLAGEPLAA